MDSVDLGNSSKLSDDDDSGISVEIEDEEEIVPNRTSTLVNREKHSESAVLEIDSNNNNNNEITKLMTCIVNQTIIDSNQSSCCSSSMSEQEPKPLLMIIDQNSTESSIISSSFSLESNAKTNQYGPGDETFASLSISKLNVDQSMTSTISCSSSPKSEVATTMLATARSSSSVSLATGAATPTNSSYLPNSPAESSSPMDDIQPLDFSTSKTTVSKRFPQTPRMEDPADDSDQAEEADDIYHNVYRKTSKHLLDNGPVALTNQSDHTKSSKLSSKFNEQHCFTTPSPSPPERHHIHTNMPPHHNYNIMTMLNGADLSNNQYHRQQQSRQSPPPSQLALSQPHLPTGSASANNNSAAAVAAAATNELMQTALVSALMQSASLNPAMVNAEFIQNLAQNASNLMAANPSLAKSLTSPNRTLAAATASSSPFLVKNGDNHLISPKLTSPNSVNFPNTLTSSSSQPSMNSAAMVAAAGLLTTASNNTNSSLPFSLHHSIPVDSSSTTNSSKKNSYQSNVNFSPQTNSTSSKYSRSSKSQHKNNKQQQHTSQHSSHPISPNNTHNNQSQLFSPTAPMPPVGTDALANQSILLSNSDPAYQEFRKQMLKSKRSSSGSRSSSTKRNSSGGKANSVDLHSDDNSNCSSSGEGEGSVNSMNSLSNATGGNGSIYGGDFQQSNLNAMMNSGMTHSMMGMSQSVTPPPTSMTTATSAITTSTDSSNGGGCGSGRKRGRPLPHYMKDDAYWERRRKNNEAAKRSRDLRRAKEDEIAIRCAFLEHENFRLKCELMQTRVEYDKVRALWLNTSQGSQQAESGQFPPALSGSNATLMNAEFMQSLAQNPSIAKSLSPLNPNSSTSSTTTTNNNSPFHFKHEPQSPPSSQRFSSSPSN